MLWQGLLGMAVTEGPEVLVSLVLGRIPLKKKSEYMVCESNPVWVWGISVRNEWKSSCIVQSVWRPEIEHLAVGSQALFFSQDLEQYLVWSG